MDASQHPNADKLQVCRVDVGTDDALTIVCGAPNARKDLLVAVAKIGSVLPGDFKIKAGKIRGEKSFGMLCSEAELGISSENEGIMEVSPELTLGASIAEAFQLQDTVFEIGLTPNRSDCLGYIGLARDLAAKLGIPLNKPEIKQENYDETLKTSDHVKVAIEIQKNVDASVLFMFKGLSIPPLLDATKARKLRNETHQPYCGCHQLRYARKWPTSPCLR